MKPHVIESAHEAALLEYKSFGIQRPNNPRKIVISKAGGFVRARYAGRKTFVFGFDAKHAMSRLKCWDGGAA